MNIFFITHSDINQNLTDIVGSPPILDLNTTRKGSKEEFP